MQWGRPAEPFLTPRGPLSQMLSAAIEAITGLTPELSTGGGTSDGRFLKDIAREVIEFGPINESIHKVDEHVLLADIAPLSLIYERVLSTLLRR
jgi:succinyl-diaminopimelate desuccinylase